MSIYLYSQFLRSGITFQQRTSPTSFDAAIPITQGLALPEGVMQKDPSWGKYLIRQRSFGLSPEFLNGIIPQPGDQINYKGDAWQICVGGVSQPKASGVFRCTCDILKFNGLVADTLYFSEAICTGASPTGERHVTNTWGSPIQGAIEPREQSIELRFGAITDPEVYDVYLLVDLSTPNMPSTVTAGSLLKDQNGYIYEIKEISKRTRLDELLHVVVERKL